MVLSASVWAFSLPPPQPAAAKSRINTTRRTAVFLNLIIKKYLLLLIPVANNLCSLLYCKGGPAGRGRL
jgi:predicted small integral membrane protein